MTVYVVFCLRKNYSDFFDEFELLVEKAIGWIEGKSCSMDDLEKEIKKLF